MLKCNFFQGWYQRVLTSVTKFTRALGVGVGPQKYLNETLEQKKETEIFLLKPVIYKSKPYFFFASGPG